MNRWLALALVLSITLVAISPVGGAMSSPRAGVAPPIRANVTADANYVSVYSEHPGQANYLAIPNNTTGLIVYSEWVVTLVAVPQQSYTVYEGDLQIVAGTASGVKTLDFNVTGSPVTVEITLGGAVYKYTGDYVLSVGVGTYFSSPPVQLIYSAEQLILSNVSIIVAAVLALLVAMLVSYRTVVARAQREVIRE